MLKHYQAGWMRASTPNGQQAPKSAGPQHFFIQHADRETLRAGDLSGFLRESCRIDHIAGLVADVARMIYRFRNQQALSSLPLHCPQLRRRAPQTQNPRRRLFKCLEPVKTIVRQAGPLYNLSRVAAPATDIEGGARHPDLPKEHDGGAAPRTETLRIHRLSQTYAEEIRLVQPQ